MRACIGVGYQKVIDALRTLVEREELIRVDMPNGKRKNPKPYYFLPDEKNLAVPYKDCLVTSQKVTNEDEAVTLDTGWNIDNLDRWKGLNRLDQIEAYTDSGLCVTPLVEGNKIPPRGWTRDRLRDTSKNSLMNFFAEHEMANVGCWLSEEILCVDVDSAEAFYGLTGGEDFDTARVSNSGRGFHLYFLNDKGIHNHNDAEKVMDFKTSGGLVVLPPSVHPSGRPYEWVDTFAPIVTPEAIKRYYDSRTASVVQLDTPTGSIGESGSPLVSRTSVLRKGNRRPSLFRYGRSRRLHVPKSEVVRELRALNQTCCRPPLDEREMSGLIHQVLNGRNRPEWIARNPQRFR
jgi:hypothetical protein